MNDGIKEILEKPNVYIFNDECYLYFGDYNKLKDYITNLQQELEVAKNNEEAFRLEMQDITKALALDEHTLFDDVKDYATNLQQENERLNHQLEVQKELTERNRLRKHCYKSRCEKAVEYIESRAKKAGVKLMSREEELIDILNGRSDE